MEKEAEISYLFGEKLDIIFVAYLFDVIQMYLIRECRNYAMCKQ